MRTVTSNDEQQQHHQRRRRRRLKNENSIALHNQGIFFIIKLSEIKLKNMVIASQIEYGENIAQQQQLHQTKAVESLKQNLNNLR